MARKKNTPSKADAPEDSKKSSKAGAISGVVKGAEFDEPDAAMADTKAEGVRVGEDDATDDDTPVQLPAVETHREVVMMEGEVVEEGASDDGEDAKPLHEPEDKPAEEPDAERASEEPAPVPPAPVTVVERRGGFWSALLGGILAAVIGFGGAIYFKAAEWPMFGAGGASDLEGMIAQQSETIATLQAALDTAQASDAEARNALSASIDELSARVDELPTTASMEPLPADVQAKLDAQRAELEELEGTLEQMRALTQDQIASAQAMQESAAQAEARAKARGALNQLRTALNTGASYASVVPEIAAATDVPEVLAANAETGVPTAAALESQFADGARAALSASLKATAGDSTRDRLTFFLKDQLGARSLTPREGDDPDAVLSRAEAALKAGDIDGALALVETLPDAGKAELQDWAAAAATRRDALAAFDSLSDALNAN
ncbi:COG4223 family protein [Litoreibacter arenae]|uniref:Mitochondrial inner membrane protein n=1 Tax=Litoreibacter arenae DSM 19593 TaxID=1123360 RepID=S9RH10_9RHOB|nr:hypothetical protein [Litoreibacter arenae]EPX77380.1 hypothetical protein thalar_03103 [Litoreibacter arenae DSM 19593]